MVSKQSSPYVRIEAALERIELALARAQPNSLQMTSLARRFALLQAAAQNTVDSLDTLIAREQGHS